MNRIFTIMLVVLFSSNVFADELNQFELNTNDAIERAGTSFVKIYTTEGNNGYLLNCPGTLSCFVIAGELCKEEGYSILSSKEYNLSTNIVNRWVILCK